MSEAERILEKNRMTSRGYGKSKKTDILRAMKEYSDQQNKDNAIEFATYVLEQSDKQNEQFEDMYDTFLRIKEGDWRTKN